MSNEGFSARDASECHVTMVNLTIRLGKAGASPGGGKQEQAGGINSVTTKGPSIPAHLVDTDLPLLKGVGTVFSEPCAVNFVGMKARRRPGDKVHICVRCNFPIAVYGRLVMSSSSVLISFVESLN